MGEVKMHVTAATWVERNGEALTLGTIAKLTGLTIETIKKRYRQGWRGWYLMRSRLDERVLGFTQKQAEWRLRPATAPHLQCSYAGKCNSGKCPLHSLPPHPLDQEQWETEAERG